MYCDRCGKTLPDNSKFCTYCGNSISDVVNSMNLKDKEESDFEGVAKASMYPQVQERGNDTGNLPYLSDQYRNNENDISTIHEKKSTLIVVLIFVVATCILCFLVEINHVPEEPQSNIRIPKESKQIIDDLNNNPHFRGTIKDGYTIKELTIRSKVVYEDTESYYVEVEAQSEKFGYIGTIDLTYVEYGEEVDRVEVITETYFPTKEVSIKVISRDIKDINKKYTIIPFNKNIEVTHDFDQDNHVDTVAIDVYNRTKNYIIDGKLKLTYTAKDDGKWILSKIAIDGVDWISEGTWVYYGDRKTTKSLIKYDYPYEVFTIKIGNDGAINLSCICYDKQHSYSLYYDIYCWKNVLAHTNVIDGKFVDCKFLAKYNNGTFHAGSHTFDNKSVFCNGKKMKKISEKPMDLEEYLYDNPRYHLSLGSSDLVLEDNIMAFSSSGELINQMTYGEFFGY